MEVIELNDSDDEAVKDTSLGRSSLKRDVSEAFDFSKDSSDDGNFMSASKKRRRTREGNQPSGGNASSAAVAFKPSASGASNFVVMLDSSDSEDSSASRQKTTMKKKRRRRRSKQSSLPTSNTSSVPKFAMSNLSKSMDWNEGMKGSVSHTPTASSGAAAKSRSKQSSSLKKSIDSLESTSASKRSPDFDFTNDSSDDESPQPFRVSKASTAPSSSTEIYQQMLSTLSKKDRETVLRLQGISDHCRDLVNEQSFNPKNAKLQTFKHGNQSIKVPIHEGDRQELLVHIKKSQSFAAIVADHRTDKKYLKHVEMTEIDIYYELAQAMAPPHLKALCRIIVVLKCPKHKELANGENIETGGSNDHSKACASVDAKDVVESSFPPTFIQRASGTIAQYINARQFCVKDPSPDSCGCLDWLLEEEQWCHRRLTAIGTYHQAIKVPSLLICFGGNSAVKVVKSFKNKHLFTFNVEFGPHLCTLVCHYGYESIQEQLVKIYMKVQSISLTVDHFLRGIATKNPSLCLPKMTLLEALCNSNKTPMVAKPTVENIEIAFAAEKKRRSRVSRDWWTPERKDERSKEMIRKWADPEDRKKWGEAWTQDRKDEQSKQMTKQNKEASFKSAKVAGKTKQRDANPLFSEKHIITVPASKTKLKDSPKVKNDEMVFACNYCVCAFAEGKIKKYKSGGIEKDPINKVYAIKKWNPNQASRHLESCMFAPDSVKGRDFTVWK